MALYEIFGFEFGLKVFLKCSVSFFLNVKYVRFFDLHTNKEFFNKDIRTVKHAVKH